MNVADEIAGVRLNVRRAIEALERLEDSDHETETALEELREAQETLDTLLQR